jgi:acetyl esterase/lipase
MSKLCWRLLPIVLAAGFGVNCGAAVKAPEWVTVDADLSYGTRAENKLDVYRSKRQAASAKAPAVILIHGGGWTEGTKEAVFNIFALPWLEKGFTVFNVEYRLAKTAVAPAAVEDVLLAAEWVRNNATKYGIDKNKIIASGDSAGGHLALMVGLTPKQAKLGPVGKIAAVVNWYGITDVQDQLEGQNQRDYAVTWVPASLPDRQELARRVSPITWAAKNDPPVLTIHGDEDNVVPYDHGVNMTKALRAAGSDAELLPVTHGGHGGFSKEQNASLWQLIFNFLEKRKLL